MEIANPLFREPDQPLPYPSVDVAAVENAVETVMREVKRLRDAVLEADKCDVDGRLLARDRMFDVLDRVLYPIYLLKETHGDGDLRAACQSGVETLFNFSTELALDEDLYQSLKEFAESIDLSQLDAVQRRYLDKCMDAYMRNGFQLGPEDRQKLKQLDNQLNAKCLAFQQNISACDDHLILSEADLEGMPADFLQSHRGDDGKFKITVETPDYKAVMKFAERVEVRRDLYNLYNNRAAGENMKVLDEILALRVERSKLLGYETFADYRLGAVMAKTPENVWRFIDDLAAKVKGKAGQDYAKLKALSGQETLQSWDKNYLTNKYKESHYQLDEEAVREYFPFAGVTQGLFTLMQELYGVDFRESPAIPVWHPDVRAYEVLDDGQAVGRFYLDMFPRPNKYSHAACFGLQSGRQLARGYQIPEAALVCNFPKAGGDKPSLLTHDDVETYFHEFGHLMHHLLTRAPIAGFAGTSVEHDFVEMPSQIMENWVWEKTSLKRFARHYKSGEPIPDELLDKMIAVRHVNSGIDAQQQLFYTAVDMTYHHGFEPQDDEATTQVVRELQSKHTFFAMVPGTHFQASFGHLVGYAAGYYGYLWSKVYADDMFSVFKRHGIFDPTTGRRFREGILAKGDTVPPMDLMVSFLGRQPKMDAYLANQGISA